MTSQKEPFPQVIFFDAVGTLFGVKDSVGAAYSTIAHQFGVEADPQTLNQAFFQSFKAASPMAFPGSPVADIPRQEYEWWEQVAVRTFEQVGLYSRFHDFSAFFSALYQYFATAEPWFVYPEVARSLVYWRQQNVELGILSNFDTRLYPVLKVLKLSDYFTSVTISTEVGAAKPERAVFEAALAKHQCSPDRAWHVGDSFREDYEGAKAAGLRAIWLKRSNT
ncbi:HAD-IA family hydrolase [Egbenema bharatensis]|uniref:HAD-IA family hydrolase n=1 Tax=Egbenema bharatensis TaxID=3463334 RepID=UPI003A87BE6A